MRIVASSVETVRVPIAAKQANAFVDPSNGGVRAITVAIVAQGAADPTSFPITGAWELDLVDTPNKYWATFLSPGSLTSGLKYDVFIKLGTQSGETPILYAPGLLEAV